MGQNEAEQPKRRLVARKAPDSHEGALSQENLSGKDLDERSGENWAPAGALSGHEGDEQLGEIR